jgi:hypothetical protein
MFERHDEIENEGDPPLRLRVLAVTSCGSRLVVLETTNPASWPYQIEADDAASLVGSGAWRVSRGQPVVHPLNHELTEAARVRRDANYELIEHIVSYEWALFDRLRRAKLVTERVRETKKARTTIDDLLRKYLHGGMCRSALTPAFRNCGAPGVASVVVPGGPKRGPKPPEGAPPGVAVTPEMRRFFCRGIDLSYAREKRHDLTSAYHLCMRRFFMREEKDLATGARHHVLVAPYDQLGLPTERQFRYWVAKDIDVEALTRRRLAPRVWEMRRRPLLGHPTAQAIGPGSIYQIDATILDTYVLSRRVRRLIVGRPTLYVVIDVFSRMIVGIYIGLESPSWIAAMMALANAVSDKVEYCRSVGIDIEPGDWPAHHVPGTVEGDRGEMISAGIEPVLRQFNMRVANKAPYRADWKGVVEVRFKLLQATFGPYVPGQVQQDFRERGAHDYRLDAALDIDDLQKIVVKAVMLHNNGTVLEDYVRHPALTEDEVPSIPLELWNWGIVNLAGMPRQPPLDRFRFALMPAGEASVTPFGINFGGRLYVCDKALEEGWFTRARDRRFKVRVSYDPRLTNHILVHDKESPSGYQLARLTPRSQNRVGLTLAEAAAIDEEERRLQANHRMRNEVARADALAEIERIASRGRSKTDMVPDPRSAQERVSGIREARAAEKASDRVVEAEAFRRDLLAEIEPAGEVVSFPQSPAPARFTEPTIAERRRLRLEKDACSAKEGDGNG